MSEIKKYIKKIQPLIKNLEIDNNQINISGIYNKSSKAVPNSIFTAVKGLKFDGHNFIADAVKNGASTVVYTDSNYNFKDCKCNRVLVSDAYYAYALMIEEFYGNPFKKLNLIGITGTNGKTTTAYLIYNILKTFNKNSSLISTVEYIYPGSREKADRTTPTAEQIQKIFSKCAEEASDQSYLVMETSSHGLYQHRPGSAEFEIAVFTNLSGDHLDYHSSMENYFAAKKILFNEYLKNNGLAVINIDDSYGQRLFNEYNGRKFSYGQQKGAFCELCGFSSSQKGSFVELKIDNKKYNINFPMAGKYNVYNMMAALCTCYSVGIPLKKLSASFEQTISVPGRLQHTESPKGVDIFIDYAHTDDALKNVLETLKPLAENRLICIFGCGGDRDRSKRPRMAAFSAKFADFSIITNDNSRNEEPEQIFSDIISGFPNGFDNYIKIPDREKAIEYALKYSEKGDIVLIAGKGHETYQETNGKKLLFDDLKKAEKIINEKL